MQASLADRFAKWHGGDNYSFYALLKELEGLEKEHHALAKSAEEALQLFKAEREKCNEMTSLVQKLGRIILGLIDQAIGIMRERHPGAQMPNGVMLHKKIYEEDGRYIAVNDKTNPEYIVLSVHFAQAAQQGKPS